MRCYCTLYRNDYSESTRLLPPDYYNVFSENAKCRIYKPACPDNDAYGFVPDEQTTQKRNRTPRVEDALKVAQSSKYICELHQLGKLISPKCYRIDCSEMNDMGSIEVGVSISNDPVYSFKVSHIVVSVTA